MKSEGKMVQITETARVKIKEVLEQNTGKYLRLFVQGIGWGGPQMGMALDEPKENEKPMDVNGINVLIEAEALPLVDSLTVDYVSDPDGEGFTIVGGSSCC